MVFRITACSLRGLTIGAKPLRFPCRMQNNGEPKGSREQEAANQRVQTHDQWRQTPNQHPERDFPNDGPFPGPLPCPQRHGADQRQVEVEDVRRGPNLNGRWV